MDRWEMIERRVLVAVGIVLVAFTGWLIFESEQPGFFVFMPPVIFWIFWQAFFEDRLQEGRPVTIAERVLYVAYLWARRVLLGCVAFALALCAIFAFQQAQFLVALCLSAAAAGITWVALFGAGRSDSAVDDLPVFRERRDRYR